MTRDQILAIARCREFIVHRYSYRDDHKRVQVRKLCDEGLMEYVRHDKQHNYFRAVKTPKPAKGT